MNRDAVIPIALTELTFTFSVLLAAFVVVSGVWRRRARRRALHADPDSLATGPQRPRSILLVENVFVAGFLIFATGNFMRMEFLEPPGHRWTAVSLAASCATASAASFFLLGRSWRAIVAYPAMILLTLSLCALAAVLLPVPQVDWPGRLPALLNALLFGFVVSAAFWTWLASVWQQQLDDAGRWWTTAGRLIPHARRLACGLLWAAFLSAVLMAVAPRLFGDRADDEAAGRLAAGLAGHLLLLVAALWCSRFMYPQALRLLAAGAAGSSLLFLAVRTAG